MPICGVDEINIQILSVNNKGKIKIDQKGIFQVTVTISDIISDMGIYSIILDIRTSVNKITNLFHVPLNHL